MGRLSLSGISMGRKHQLFLGMATCLSLAFFKQLAGLYCAAMPVVLAAAALTSGSRRDKTFALQTTLCNMSLFYLERLGLDSAVQCYLSPRAYEIVRHLFLIWVVTPFIPFRGATTLWDLALGPVVKGSQQGLNLLANVWCQQCTWPRLKTWVASWRGGANDNVQFRELLGDVLATCAGRKVQGAPPAEVGTSMPLLATVPLAAGPLAAGPSAMALVLLTSPVVPLPEETPAAITDKDHVN